MKVPTFTVFGSCTWRLHSQPLIPLRGLTHPRNWGTMFSTAPQILPVSRRAWGIGLGTLIMVGVPIVTISAKTVQFLLPLLLAGALAGAFARNRLAYARPRLDAVSVCLLLLIFYAGLSALWARDPLTSLSCGL